MVNAMLTHLIWMATLTLVSTTLGSPIPPTTTFSSPTLQPLCISQFALVNHACASIPLPRSAFALLPPPPPPSPEDPLGGSSEGLDVKPKHRGGGRHHRHKGHRGKGSEPVDVAVAETEAQKECCRWLRALDVTCVCDVLVYLPVFMSKPAHKFSVVVDELCEVKYECPGRKFG